MSYPDFSPYSYCAGNPIVFIDKKGETIWIYYMDQKGKEQRVDYRDLEKIKEINNEFVNKTVLAFEQIKSWSNEADDRYNFKKDIDFVANADVYYGFPLEFKIYEKTDEGGSSSGEPLGCSTIIKVDLNKAMIGNVQGKNTVALPPSASLFHEFFEQWRGIIQGLNDDKSDYAKWEQQYKDQPGYHEKCDKGEEFGLYELGSDMYIITLLESYVAKNYYSNKEELYRDSHKGPFEEYPTESVTSVKCK